MKVLVGACPTALLLLLALCSPTFCVRRPRPITTYNANGPVCCTSYVKKPIEFNTVIDYYIASEQCPQPAIVFITEKDQEVCANPADKWAQRYITRLAEE